MQEICKKYAKYSKQIAKICTIRKNQEICKKYARSMQEVCKKYARSMQEISWICKIYAKEYAKEYEKYAPYADKYA